MDPDPKLEIVVVPQRGLDRQRTVHGVYGAREDREELVPGLLDPLAVVLLEQGADDRPVALPHPQPPVLALRHQGCVAHDVR